MSTESDYIDSLGDSILKLSSPVPVEISGENNNWVVTWVETNIEGEGNSIPAAMKDLKQQVRREYHKLDSKVRTSGRLDENDQRKWTAFCHYIEDASGSTRRDLGTYKGPVFG